MRLGLQMLEAVKSMHEMGFLHRDIKPVSYNLHGQLKYANNNFFPFFSQILPWDCRLSTILVILLILDLLGAIVYQTETSDRLESSKSKKKQKILTCRVGT